jgi:hypothetical protein
LSHCNTSDNVQTHLTVESKSVSRDQCDSAIFESESILEDLDASPKALLCKIEQLRTHLVRIVFVNSKLVIIDWLKNCIELFDWSDMLLALIWFSYPSL